MRTTNHHAIKASVLRRYLSPANFHHYMQEAQNAREYETLRITTVYAGRPLEDTLPFPGNLLLLPLPSSIPAPADTPTHTPDDTSSQESPPGEQILVLTSQPYPPKCIHPPHPHRGAAAKRKLQRDRQRRSMCPSVSESSDSDDDNGYSTWVARQCPPPFRSTRLPISHAAQNPRPGKRKTTPHRVHITPHNITSHTHVDYTGSPVRRPHHSEDLHGLAGLTALRALESLSASHPRMPNFPLRLPLHRGKIGRTGYPRQNLTTPPKPWPGPAPLPRLALIPTCARTMTSTPTLNPSGSWVPSATSRAPPRSPSRPTPPTPSWMPSSRSLRALRIPRTPARTPPMPLCPRRGSHVV